jgi:hypothetical protein
VRPPWWRDPTTYAYVLIAVLIAVWLVAVLRAFQAMCGWC